MLTERCSAEHKDARSKWFPKILPLALATFILSSSSSVDLISLKPFLSCRQEREQVFELEARAVLVCVVFTNSVFSRVVPTLLSQLRARIRSYLPFDSKY